MPSCGFKLKFFPFKFKKVHLLTCSVLLFFFLQHPKTTCMHEMCFFNTAGCFTFEQQCSSEVQFNLNTTSFGNKVIIHERKKKVLKHRTTCSVKICKSCHCINTFAPCTGDTMTNTSQPLSQHCEIPDYRSIRQCMDYIAAVHVLWSYGHLQGCGSWNSFVSRSAP